MSGSIPVLAPTPARRSVETIGAITISVLVVASFGVVTILAVLGKIPDAPIVHDLVGALILGFGSVLSYWIGSSTGSKAKDSQIATQSAQLAASVPVSALPPGVGAGTTP